MGAWATPCPPGRLAHGGQLSEQIRQGQLHGIPSHLKVDIEIAVGNAVTHAAHAAPRHLGVSLGELGVAVHHFGGGFTNDDEAHDHRLLGTLVSKTNRLSPGPAQKCRHPLPPETCGPDNPAACLHSYRLRLRQHSGAECRRQIIRRQQIDMNAEQ